MALLSRTDIRHPGTYLQECYAIDPAILRPSICLEDYRSHFFVWLDKRDALRCSLDRAVVRNLRLPEHDQKKVPVSEVELAIYPRIQAEVARDPRVVDLIHFLRESLCREFGVRSTTDIKYQRAVSRSVVRHGFPRSTGPATGNPVVGEPITGEHRNLLERAGFFEQMSGTGNHGERALARDCGLRPSIQFQRHFIASPDDQQRRCVDFGQRPTGRGRAARRGRPPLRRSLGDRRPRPGPRPFPYWHRNSRPAATRYPAGLSANW
jgi:hypothetical protein